MNNIRNKKKGGSNSDNSFFSNPKYLSIDDKAMIEKAKKLSQELADFWSQDMLLRERNPGGRNDPEYMEAFRYWQHWNNITSLLNTSNSRNLVETYLPLIQIEWIRLGLANFKTNYDKLSKDLNDIEKNVTDISSRVKKLVDNKQQTAGKLNKKNKKK